MLLPYNATIVLLTTGNYPKLHTLVFPPFNREGFCCCRPSDTSRNPHTTGFKGGAGWKGQASPMGDVTGDLLLVIPKKRSCLGWVCLGFKVPQAVGGLSPPIPYEWYPSPLQMNQQSPSKQPSLCGSKVQRKCNHSMEAEFSFPPTKLKHPQGS